MVIDSYISFFQQKTKDFIKIKLNKTALSIIEEQAKNKKSDYIFPLPEPSTICRHIKNWICKSGIKKKITISD